MKDTLTTGKVVLCQAEDGGIQLEAKLEEESIWLSMAQIAELFHVNVPAISKHIKNIFTAKELVPSATVSKMETVRTEGKRRLARDKARDEFAAGRRDIVCSRACESGLLKKSCSLRTLRTLRLCARHAFIRVDPCPSVAKVEFSVISESSVAKRSSYHFPAKSEESSCQLPVPFAQPF